MDTLVSLGVLASFLWSAYALFLGGAGVPGMRMPFSLVPSASDGVAHVYLEAAVGVPLFVLPGRFLEAGPGAGPGRRCGRSPSSPRRRSRYARTAPNASSDRRAASRGGLRRPSRRTGRHRRRGCRGQLRRRPVPGHRRDRAHRGRPGLGRDRRIGQRGRPAAGARDRSRRGHAARPHHQARDGRPGRQGAGPAPGRHGGRRLRARRAGPRGHHARILARRRRRPAGRDHRLRGRPRRRLPVRAGPRDPDRADGRHRARRPAGRPGQRAAGAGGAPAHRHRRPRQDRHPDLRAHERRPGHRRT